MDDNKFRNFHKRNFTIKSYLINKQLKSHSKNYIFNLQFIDII
jgi:hypothetical protein